MWAKHKQKAGFTIPELLIIIVVIGILVSIGLMTYTNIQQRGKNTRTRQALSSWIKAIDLYKKDRGTLPNGNACLGTGYAAASDSDSSNQGQCGHIGASTVITESPDFNKIMQPYIRSTPLPTPALVTTKSTNADWLMGITYSSKDSDSAYVQAVYAGQLGSCPTVAGVPATYSTWDSNTNCQYKIRLTADS